MTVIAWDGKSLAADRQLTSSGMRHRGTKIQRLKSGAVVAWCGSLDSALALIKWYEDGAKPEDFPECQKDKDRWTNLIVYDRGIFWYEQEPIPIRTKERFMAWGSGRDFAMGAMAMGATAKEAVAVANKLCTTCGYGVDSVDVK